MGNKMAINFKPFDELFEPSYQLNYISLGGYIDVGPNTYSVFYNYTMQERQVIFQVCEKYLPWRYSDEQEHWERTMYMYQWIIKSPSPFPYLQYTLNENIKMELIQLRNYNSKTFDNGDGTKTTQIHCGHIHYVDSQGNFQDVNYSFEDMVTYWRMVKANYNLYIAKDFGAAQLIRYDNKFNGADHTIIFEPHSLQWVNKNNPDDRHLIAAAQNVTGVLDGHSIVYENAFGNDIDFVIELRRHGFKKYIRFNSQPMLNPPTVNHVPVLLFKYQGDGLTVKAAGETAWDGVSFYEGIDGFEFTESQSQYKSYLAKAYIWDSSERENRQKVKIFFEKRNGVLWQAKVLPKNYFVSATYPVMSDAYPYADTAGDGVVNKVDEASWADARTAAAGDNAVTNGTGAQADSEWEAGPLFHCQRTFLPFPTGGTIPAAATIVSADLALYCNWKSDADGNGEIAIVQTKQNDVVSLEVGDYDECGESTGSGWSNASQTDIIEGATRKDIGDDMVDLAYNTFALDATGLSWIARNGETLPAGATQNYTHIGVREGYYDIDNTAAPATGANRIIIYMSDSAGTSTDPKLTVTYTVPAIMTTNTSYWGSI